MKKVSSPENSHFLNQSKNTTFCLENNKDMQVAEKVKQQIINQIKKTPILTNQLTQSMNQEKTQLNYSKDQLQSQSETFKQIFKIIKQKESNFDDEQIENMIQEKVEQQEQCIQNSRDFLEIMKQIQQLLNQPKKEKMALQKLKMQIYRDKRKKKKAQQCIQTHSIFTYKKTQIEKKILDDVLTNWKQYFYYDKQQELKQKYLQQKLYNNYKHTLLEYCIVNLEGNFDTNIYKQDNENIQIDPNLIKICCDILKKLYSVQNFFKYCAEGNLQAVYCIVQKQGNSEILNKIDQNDIDQKRNGWLYACYNGRYDIVRLMYEQYQINIEFENSLKYTGLLYACCNNKIKIAKLLLEYKANINHKNQEGLTPLLIGCYYNHKYIVKLLLEHNADLTIEDNNGRNAFYYSCFNYSMDNIIQLFEHGYQKGEDELIEKDGFDQLSDTQKKKVREYFKQHKQKNKS